MKLGVNGSLLDPPLLAGAAPAVRLTIRRPDALAFERDETAEGA
jgi:hypothetical protein